MLKGRRMAFDYGDARIGIAISDMDGLLAVPLATVKNVLETRENELRALVAEYSPIHLYVGRPLHLSGKEGESSAKAKAFSELLKDITGIPVSLIDERLSTVSAARALKEAGRTAKQARKVIDEAAAVEILEMALNAEKAKR
ncbi:unannotated protein [freshwater metagenome]|uniref:Unannotated protein n=1 Tax=freshwater metagenome TaxID=449393 RepID=A0A6J6WBW8_9ZZZZ|nr:Holliday junction resolvase RuvX [Actinomycetota bacterium]MSZ69351.1 Holliday junction resolvase RuvX [Actinomycetota bacterium]